MYILLQFRRPSLGRGLPSQPLQPWPRVHAEVDDAVLHVQREELPAIRGRVRIRVGQTCCQMPFESIEGMYSNEGKTFPIWNG